MSNLTNDLEDVIADANAQLAAIAGGATDTHLNAVGAIAAAAEQARLSAEALENALAAQAAAAAAAADAYFDAIAWVRDAITTGGDLSQTEVVDPLVVQLTDALNQLATLEDLDPLLAEVVSYDEVGSKAVTDAQTALDEKTAALKVAEDNFATQQAALDAASQAVTSWAAQALTMGTQGYQQLAALKSAIDAGRLYEAVVLLQDLKTTRFVLEEPVDFDKHQFDVDNTDFDDDNPDLREVTVAINDAWAAVHDNYEMTLTTLVDKQDDFYAAQLALAVAEADADERRARRLVDAAALVKVLHESLEETE